MKTKAALGWWIGIAVAIVLAVAGCKKQPPPGKAVQNALTPGARMPPGHPGGGPGLPSGHPPTGGGKVAEPKLVIPDNVKDKWSGVVLVVVDKEKKKTQELKVKLQSDTKLPGSDLTVHVGAFLPDFSMGAGKITSSSDKPNNPAVQVQVKNAKEVVFKGWLFSRFPTIHPFEHARFSIVLKAGTQG